MTNQSFAQSAGLDEFEDEGAPYDPRSRHQLAMRDFAAQYGFKKETYTQYQLGMILSRYFSDMHMQGYFIQDDDREAISKLTVTEEEFEILKPFALMLACLAGNAFPQITLQYCADAKYFLINNGWWDEICEKGLTNEHLAYDKQLR